jgi:hypothetical protein
MREAQERIYKNNRIRQIWRKIFVIVADDSFYSPEFFLWYIVGWRVGRLEGL